MTATATASTHTIANELVALCRTGRNLDAIAKLYSPQIVSVEPVGNDAMPAEISGIDAIREKNKWWLRQPYHPQSRRDRALRGRRPVRSAVRVRRDHKPSGQRFTLAEVALYTARGRQDRRGRSSSTTCPPRAPDTGAWRRGAWPTLSSRAKRGILLAVSRSRPARSLASLGMTTLDLRLERVQRAGRARADRALHRRGPAKQKTLQSERLPGPAVEVEPVIMTDDQAVAKLEARPRSGCAPAGRWRCRYTTPAIRTRPTASVARTVRIRS